MQGATLKRLLLCMPPAPDTKFVSSGKSVNILNVHILQTWGQRRSLCAVTVMCISRLLSRRCQDLRLHWALSLAFFQINKQINLLPAHDEQVPDQVTI